MHVKPTLITRATLASLAVVASQAHAFDFETENISGSFVSTIGIGTGIRTSSPDCGLVVRGAQGSDAPAGCLSPASGLGDQGDLNYKKGDAFTTYLKGTHELLLKLPEDVTFMARGAWTRDFSATKTTGIVSGASTLTDSLSKEAADALTTNARILDFWVAKGFELDEHKGRVRLGNQVFNWGESMFLGGGINAVNPVDIQRQATPGTQIKETLLAVPAVDTTVSLTQNLSLEAYYQFGYKESYLPPAGSYWSTSTLIGSGSAASNVTSIKAKDSGQWGAALRWQPESTSLNLAAYVINYHDKTPQFGYDAAGAYQWTYLEDRKMYGVSGNMPVGDWAIGSELSYRPKDAVSLNPNQGCAALGGNCWVESGRWQMNINGLYSMTPSNSQPFLDLVKADAGTFMIEYAATYLPGLQATYAGIPVSAAYVGWGQETDDAGTSVATGTPFSSGVAFDFSVTYDSTLISGWQVTPELYYYRALNGQTPNIGAQFMNGAQSMNLALNFTRNPGTWQATINYARFWGGSALENPYKDRDYVGMSVSRTF